jgi:uncharacterized protein
VKKGEDMKKMLLTLLTALILNPAWGEPLENSDDAIIYTDFATALKIVLPPAVRGEAWAQHSLAHLYVRGQGVVQDYAEAVKWFRLAAQQGNVHAQNMLGQMYGNGEGVEQDYVKAHGWYNLAASKGQLAAFSNRDIVAKLMSAQQIAEAQKLARDCQARNFKGCD